MLRGRGACRIGRDGSEIPVSRATGGFGDYVMSIRWWIPAGILVLGMAGCGWAHEPTAAGEEHSEKDEAHVTVRTELAKRGAIVEAVGGLGRCEALPDHTACNRIERPTGCGSSR
jgi:hypothetical protein